jgi:hypothetical protein
MKHVPWFRVVEMGLVDRYALEWFNPLSAISVTPFEVLSRRIKIRYSDPAANDASDWYRYRELNPAELQNVVLSLPFNQLQFESKMATLQHWFDNDDTLDQCSSHYLIACLYLEQYAYARLTVQGLQVKESIVSQFNNFVKSLPESSRAVQRSVQGNVLGAWQELYDMKLKIPGLGSAQIHTYGNVIKVSLSNMKGAILPATFLPSVLSMGGLRKSTSG